MKQRTERRVELMPGRASMAADRIAGAANMRLARPSTRLLRFLSASAPDAVFLADMAELITEARRTVSARSQPHPDYTVRSARPLRVLLLGYTGAGNTGADLRTIGVIRQLRTLFGDGNIDITVFACGDMFDHPVLQSVHRLATGAQYVPDALEQVMPGFDVVLNVEGSTYTSKFSDALAGILIGGVALAAAHGKHAFAYGIDAGTMSVSLQAFSVSQHRGVHITARSSKALRRLKDLGIPAEEGADTAWGYLALSNDGAPSRVTPVMHGLAPGEYVALCPNNPYCWPVVSDVQRAMRLDHAGAQSNERHGPFTFHTWDEARARSFSRYKQAFAEVMAWLVQHGVTPVLVAMEKLDASACHQIAAYLPFPVRVVVRGEHDLQTVARTVAEAKAVITTRYHAALLGLSHAVPTVGISMDERIDQLFDDADLSRWVCHTGDVDLAKRVEYLLTPWIVDGADTLERVTPSKSRVNHRASASPTRQIPLNDGKSLKDAYRELSCVQRKRFDEMGRRLVDTVLTDLDVRFSESKK
ncbi:polysaccharide pyruvyl transferase family protein [Robbsia andropogonis]|uniref:polysaccharide pyruvyl transferase family protein n=1 Tax=Robbsia andropogonis TaxID=28092 RepID=UPI0012FCA033|nr:polysaccharide pyruvyl transferase family protein [Robbsia andropogonis]